MIRYIGLDKDGTLIDSVNLITKEWGKILHEDYGVDSKKAEEIFGVIAAGQPTIVQLELCLKNTSFSFSKEELGKRSSEIAVRLGENVKAEPFPEVSQVLQKLKELGYKMFISSGHQESVVRKDLERTNLGKYIDYFVGARPDEPDFIKGEPQFRAIAAHFGVPFDKFVKEAVFVGDTPADVKAANASGLISIARIDTVQKEKLIEAGAKYVIKDLTELLELLAFLS